MKNVSWLLNFRICVFLKSAVKVTTCGKPIFYIEIAMFQVAFLVIKTDAVEWFFCNTAKSAQMLPTSRQPRPFHLVEHFQQRGGKEEPSGHKKNNKKQKQKEGFYFNQYILSLMYFRCNKVCSCVILPLQIFLALGWL